MLRLPPLTASTQWHRWFAWWPVLVHYRGGHAIAWLRWVERRWSREEIRAASCWEYRA